jgi:hypothetical protein
VTSSLLTTFGMASITAGGIGMSGFFAERSTAAVIIFRSPRSCFGSLSISDSMFSLALIGFQCCHLSRQVLPAFYDHIAIRRADFHAVAFAV